MLRWLVSCHGRVGCGDGALSEVQSQRIDREMRREKQKQMINRSIASESARAEWNKRFGNTGT